MASRGFEKFVERQDNSREQTADPFADVRLVSGRAKSRAVVRQRLRELKQAGQLRLTDVLRQPESIRIYALECLTNVVDGVQQHTDGEFGDMRFRFRCDARDANGKPETRQYKIGVRVIETVDVGGGVSVAGEVSTYDALEPHYVSIPSGVEVDLDAVKGIRLMLKYGQALAATAEQRAQMPWVEIDFAGEEGFAGLVVPKVTKSAGREARASE